MGVEYGSFGWSLLPLFVVDRRGPARPGPIDLPTKVLLALAAVKSLALLYNP